MASFGWHWIRLRMMKMNCPNEMVFGTRYLFRSICGKFFSVATLSTMIGARSGYLLTIRVDSSFRLLSVYRSLKVVIFIFCIHGEKKKHRVQPTPRGKTQSTNMLDHALKYLYVNGPRMLGGWEGTREAAICNHLTNVEIWDALPNECHQLIMRKCHAYATLLYFAGGIYALCKCSLLLPSMMACKTHTKRRHRLVGATSLALVTLDARGFATEALK